MTKALVVYDSATGNTEKMAKAIGDGLWEAGLIVAIQKVDNTTMDDLASAEAIVLGSPTYFCTMSGKMKALIDKSIKIYEPGRKLQDKIGAAFTSSDDVAGGNETTLLSLIQAMLMHQMVIVGHQSGTFGAVSVGTPDKNCITQCQLFGKRIASFVKR